MRCLFKPHKFKRTFDVILGGLIARHVTCENCNLEYALMWHLEKPHKPSGKTVRFKFSVAYSPFRSSYYT
jgi:hypothetical protein